MNPIQKKLLELADTVDLGKRTYYRLSKELGVDHPYKVKFALDQLEKKGLIIRNRSTGTITKPSEEFTGFINVPFYGEVNCGQALSFADNEVKSFLKISPSVLKTGNYKNLFALKASGWSMNKANISNRSISDGDYVIVEKIEPHEVKNGDYIVSDIGGVANLKRFYRDDIEQRIVLFSESTEEIPPIIISAQDSEEIIEYQPIARAIEIIPGIKASESLI